MGTIVLTTEDRKHLMLKRKPQSKTVEPHARRRDYGEPTMRGCAFPTTINPNRGTGRVTAPIHSLWQVPTKGKK